MAQEEATTNRPFSSSSFISSRLLVGAAIAAVSLLLLVVGPTREAAAQAQSGAQVHCGPWQVQQRGSSEEGYRYWNYRWCHSPEVSGGWYQDFAEYSLVSPQETTVQQTAAGDNNHPGPEEDSPLLYKQVDSRPDFREGFYRHLLDCPQDYKAIGGGFDLNTPEGSGAYWTILASRPAGDKRGDKWAVDAYGHGAFFGSRLPTFTAYAICAPQDLLTGLRYESEDTTLSPSEIKTIRPTCGRDQRVIGGGFDFGGNTDLKLVRSERASEDVLSWGSGAKNVPEGRREPATMWAWAVCVSSSALENLRYLSRTDTATRPSSLRAVANTTYCAGPGTYLLSGGAGIPDNNFGSNTGYPRWFQSNLTGVGQKFWRASAVLRDHEVTVNAHALCGKFAGR